MWFFYAAVASAPRIFLCSSCKAIDISDRAQTRVVLRGAQAALARELCAVAETVLKRTFNCYVQLTAKSPSMVSHFVYRPDLYDNLWKDTTAKRLDGCAKKLMEHLRQIELRTLDFYYVFETFLHFHEAFAAEYGTHAFWLQHTHMCFCLLFNAARKWLHRLFYSFSVLSRFLACICLLFFRSVGLY